MGIIFWYDIYIIYVYIICKYTWYVCIISYMCIHHIVYVYTHMGMYKSLGLLFYATLQCLCWLYSRELSSGSTGSVPTLSTPAHSHLRQPLNGAPGTAKACVLPATLCLGSIVLFSLFHRTHFGPKFCFIYQDCFPDFLSVSTCLI